MTISIYTTHYIDLSEHIYMLRLGTNFSTSRCVTQLTSFATYHIIHFDALFPKSHISTYLCMYDAVLYGTKCHSQHASE